MLLGFDTRGVCCRLTINSLLGCVCSRLGTNLGPGELGRNRADCRLETPLHGMPEKELRWQNSAYSLYDMLFLSVRPERASPHDA